MTPQELLDYSGGNRIKAALTAKVTEQCIKNWLIAGKIPPLQQRSIEVLTKGALRTDE